MVDRDPRAMNRMDPETKIAHARLEEWGRWAKDAEARAWPSVTLLARVMEQGTSAAGQSGKPPIAMPDHVAAVDAAVCRLGDVDRKAIRLYYLRWEPAEVLARRMERGMRARQFLNVVSRARWRISVMLDTRSLNATLNG